MAATSRLRYRHQQRLAATSAPRRAISGTRRFVITPSLERFHDGCGGYSAERKSFFFCVATDWRSSGDLQGRAEGAARCRRREARYFLTDNFRASGRAGDEARLVTCSRLCLASPQRVREWTGPSSDALSTLGVAHTTRSIVNAADTVMDENDGGYGAREHVFSYCC